ncbi:family 114 glycoside hydrolase, partial [Microthyrium microscopicum]
ICYFSAGTAEDWRPDYASFTSDTKGKCLPDWSGESWVDYTKSAVWDIMAARIKLASEKGCDGIDPDDMDGYANDNGVGLSEKGATTYLKKLAAEAAKYGMGTGLKNALEILPSVKNQVQFAVNEECVQNSGDCASYKSFGKPVYHI